MAVHSHYKRLMHGANCADVEIDKSNILLIGPTGSGKTLLGADAGPDSRRAVRHRRRHHADRGRLRGRGRGEPAAEAAARRRLRHRSGPARHALHRRDRQDRQDQPERLDHPRRVRRRRAAGAAEDARRDGRQRAAPRRPQASRAAIHPDGHHEHPVHLRRDVRRARRHHRPAAGQADHRLHARGRAPRSDGVGRPAGSRSPATTSSNSA